MKKKIKLVDKGFGTKIKKGLVLTGNLNWDNGATYKGALKSQKQQIPHGYGIYFFPEHGQMRNVLGIDLAIIKYYSGNFKNALFHGKGKFKSTGEYEYSGEFKKGNFDGKGVIKYWNTEETFDGIFKNNEKISGKWVLPDGNKYEGQIKNNMPDGFGSVKYKLSGQKYIGNFKDGLFHGKGTQFSKNDSIYEGGFKNGERHGYGCVSAKKDKSYYHGQWVNGLRSGNGIFDFGDGGIYKGKWQNDTMHGKGILTESKGKQAGTSHSGNWKNGQMDGIYIFKDKSEKKRKELWREDKFIKII